jgi:hypothetical protein
MAPQRILIVLGLTVAVAGCSTPLTTREKGALTGGAIGAGAGAAIGSASGNTGTGALIGAGLGVVSGAVIGDALQANEQRQAAPPPPAAAPPVAVAPPPPPAVAVPPPIVDTAPQLVWVPQWGVYVLEGQDIVYHDGFYYYAYEGRWYVSRHHAGPWEAPRAYPPVLAKVPRGNFHKKLPPGLQKQGKIPPGHMR